jgi:hypothetical protein
VGTWSTSILGSDVALDVREQYLALLSEGLEGPAASRQVIADNKEAIRDTDDGPVFWLALAATQWEYGRLQREVKKRALAIIDTPETLTPWNDSQRSARKGALAALRKKLLSPQPKQKRPRARKAVEVPRHSLAGPDGLTGATAFQIGNLGQVSIEIENEGHKGGGGVFAAECRQDQIGLRWIDADTLEISYPAGTKPQKRRENTFFRGRTIQCVYKTTRSRPQPR